MIDFVTVGKKIATQRKKLKLTQDELANRVYVSRQLVSKWELGTGIPTIDTLLDLTKLFNISFEELLCLEEKVEVDESNLFSGHDRLFIINNIINHNLKVNLPDVFYQFSSNERLLLLKAINEGKLATNLPELLPRLTPGEKQFLKKGGIKNDFKKSN